MSDKKKGLDALQLMYRYISHEPNERPYVNLKTLELGAWHLSRQDTGFRAKEHDSITVEYASLQAYADEPNAETLDKMAEAIHRNAHFSLLNSGMAVAGMRWPVTEAIYWEFLEVLPPLPYSEKSEGFRICEASGTDALGNYIRSAYYFENGTYWHEYVADKRK